MEAGSERRLAEPSKIEITRMLRAWNGGDEQALHNLTPIVYAELRRIARSYMKRENPGNSLQATALVHEAYVRLVDARIANWRDRAHFFAVSAQMMRRILVDAARRREADKRGGQAVRVELNESIDGGPVQSDDILRLHDALEALAKVDERKAKVVELRFFGGLTIEETAAILKLSEQSVMRDWRLARVWLAREMSP